MTSDAGEDSVLVLLARHEDAYDVTSCQSRPALIGCTLYGTFYGSGDVTLPPRFMVCWKGLSHEIDLKMLTKVYRTGPNSKGRGWFLISLGAPMIFHAKTGRVPYLGLELTMHVLKSQIYLLRQSL